MKKILNWLSPVVNELYKKMEHHIIYNPQIKQIIEQLKSREHTVTAPGSNKKDETGSKETMNEESFQLVAEELEQARPSILLRKPEHKFLR